MAAPANSVSRLSKIIPKAKRREEAVKTVADTPCIAGIPSHVLNIKNIISNTMENDSRRITIYGSARRYEVRNYSRTKIIQ